jgi:hypothetical protein
MKDIFEVAIEGAKAQTDLDKLLTKALKAARRLEEVTERGIELGMVKPIRGKVLLSQARAATGAVSSAAHAFAVLHKEQTMVCAENGCDIPPVTSVGGVSVMGGGDR